MFVLHHSHLLSYILIYWSLFSNNFILMSSGDHIRIRHPLYDHHMLVVKVIDKYHVLVIHFTVHGSTSKDFVSGEEGNIVLEQEIDLHDSQIELVCYQEYVDIHESEVALMRA